jgi:2-(S-pantetheinyl)-carbapenam-3-carboxylate methyltransferase
VKIGLVQINMGGKRARTVEGEDAPPDFGLLPYSVGLLKSYAQVHAAEQHEWLVPIYRRLPVSEGADALAGADVAGFSAYVWNARLSLAIAAELKRRQPETLIVFGGPHVPDRAPATEAFLREHPYVDVVCHGEGEVVFTALLDRAASRDFSDVPGISFLDAQGRFEQHRKAARLLDLEEIPSPYTSGAFDDLFATLPGNRWVMIWETNRGCPFSCAFCDWGSATASKVYRFDIERLFGEIDWMAQREIAFVWVADANFGALKRDYELTQRVVESFQRTGFPSSMTTQSTKNATDRAYEIQKLLQSSLNAYGVTLALQSVNEGTLADINRANISSESYRELQRRFAADGVYTYTDLILGLPGESYEEFVSGISRVIADGQNNHLQIFCCSVLPNAEMGDPAYQERFGMKMQPQVIRNNYDLIDDDAWEVEEFLDIVVTTDAMPAPDWVRAKTFAWMSDLCYFDRVLQIPLLVLSTRHGWPVHELVEKLIAADPERQPTIARIVAELREKAISIQEGGPEYCPVPEANGLLWPADQRALIFLAIEGKVDAFYEEAGELLGELLEERGVPEDRTLLDEALFLNRAAYTYPFESEGQLMLFSHNLWEHYQSLLVGRPIELEEGMYVHHVNRKRQNWSTIEDWADHLSFTQGKDRRGFLRPVTTPQPLPQRAPVTAA